jgi:DNA-binding IclR family transcriptional regulator
MIHKSELTAGAANLAVPENGTARKIKSKEDRHFVSALARGLKVLACFRSGHETLGNHELARRSSLPKSTISRLTYTLTKLGYLHYVQDSVKYRLGTATLALGSAMLARMDVRQMARPMMQELADLSRAMVSLGVRERLSMIYIENCRSQSALTLSLDVGSRIPLATTAMGRAYIAALPDAQRDEVLDQIRAQDEPNWPKLRAGIEACLEQYRRLGCCHSFGDWQKDVNAIAVAFRPGSGLSPMSINCGGPAFHLSPDFLLDEVRPRLIDVAGRLEASLGTVLMETNAGRGR